MNDRPTYCFRWSNITLETYTESRRAKAQSLRKDAAMLIIKADAIEEEANSLAVDMQEADANAQ